MRRPYYLALFAEGLMAAEQWDAARAILDQGPSLVCRGDRRKGWSAPELTRLQGMLAARNEPERCEELLRHALVQASELHAKSWELRAATSLANLLCKRGESEAADKTLLRPYLRLVYRGFRHTRFESRENTARGARLISTSARIEIETNCKFT